MNFFKIYHEHETIYESWNTKPGAYIGKCFISFLQVDSPSSIRELESIFQESILSIYENCLWQEQEINKDKIKPKIVTATNEPISTKPTRIISNLSTAVANSNDDDYLETTLSFHKPPWRYEIWMLNSRELLLIAKYLETAKFKDRELLVLHKIDDELARKKMKPTKFHESIRTGGQGSKGIYHGIYGKGELGEKPIYGHDYLLTDENSSEFFNEP